MKKLLFIAAVLLVVGCAKNETKEIEDFCYICTGIEQIVSDGRVVSTTALKSYSMLTPDTDTLKSYNASSGLTTLRFMDCQKK